jgi:hypothetical protein
MRYRLTGPRGGDSLDPFHQKVPDRVGWLSAKMLKTRVADGYCSRDLIAEARPYANICGQLVHLQVGVSLGGRHPRVPQEPTHARNVAKTSNRASGDTLNPDASSATSATRQRPRFRYMADLVAETVLYETLMLAGNGPQRGRSAGGRRNSRSACHRRRL